MRLETLERIISAAKSTATTCEPLNVLRMALMSAEYDKATRSAEELEGMIDALESGGQHPWSVI